MKYAQYLSNSAFDLIQSTLNHGQSPTEKEVLRLLAFRAVVQGALDVMGQGDRSFSLVCIDVLDLLITDAKESGQPFDILQDAREKLKKQISYKEE